MVYSKPFLKTQDLSSADFIQTQATGASFGIQCEGPCSNESYSGDLGYQCVNMQDQPNSIGIIVGYSMPGGSCDELLSLSCKVIINHQTEALCMSDPQHPCIDGATCGAVSGGECAAINFGTCDDIDTLEIICEGTGSLPCAETVFIEI
ncbi:MAG: hypothetical protein Q8Q33_09165 [Chlamydiota bacterium]|nr:hypothetical protein [Chlamydiota bacterium]